MNQSKHERRRVNGAVDDGEQPSEPLRPGVQGTLARGSVKRCSHDRRRSIARLPPRPDGNSITIESLSPGDDVRIVVGRRGRFHGFVVVLASELERVLDALAREVDRRREASRASGAAREAAVGTGNRLRHLRSLSQRDGYVAAFRDDGIALRARAGRLLHRPESLSSEHAALLDEFRVELVSELEEIARTVAPQPRELSNSCRSRGAR